MFKKSLALLLAVCCIIGLLAGCGGKTGSDGDKVTITVGNWPTSTGTAEYEKWNYYLEQMNKKYPEIEIVQDTWAYRPDTFVPKAASKQLPTVYPTFLTEVDKIVNNGYALDVTHLLEKYGYIGESDPQVLSIATRDGKIYGIPQDAYCLGLMVNVDIFKEAGLTNEDGTPMIPQTYDEMLETAKIIKAKTGKAGFILPTNGNQGGWLGSSMAWSFGTEFMKEVDGKWQATFNGDGFVAWLQYMKDMRWEHNVIYEKSLIDYSDMINLFATGQAAMTINSTGYMPSVLIEQYGMSRDSIAIGAIPGGAAGRYSLVGGALYMIAPNATEEQAEAVFKWIEIVGNSPVINDDTKEAWRISAETESAQGRIVGVEPLGIWGRDGEVFKTKMDIIAPYTNVDLKMFEGYMDTASVELRVEEPMFCQELYKTIDDCLQAVLSDANADVRAIAEKANSNFQKNYFDN